MLIVDWHELIGDAASIAVVLPTIYIPTPLQYVVPLLVLSNDRPPPLPFFPIQLVKNMATVGADGRILGT